MYKLFHIVYHINSCRRSADLSNHKNRTKYFILFSVGLQITDESISYISQPIHKMSYMKKTPITCSKVTSVCLFSSTNKARQLWYETEESKNPHFEEAETSGCLDSFLDESSEQLIFVSKWLANSFSVFWAVDYFDTNVRYRISCSVGKCQDWL